MNDPPASEGPYVPTREDHAFAHYVLSYHEGFLVGAVKRDYHDRARSPGDDDLLAVLGREGFFADKAPVIDVACGPSPHVGYRLCEWHTDRDVYFLDADPTALKLHRQLYREFQHEHGGMGELREHWLLGDALDEPYLLTHKAVLVHGTLPTMQGSGNPLSQPSPDVLRTTLDGLLSALPTRLALYFDGDREPSHPEHPAHVRAALDHLGVNYRVVEDVASADFTPREGGTLLYLTP